MAKTMRVAGAVVVALCLAGTVGQAQKGTKTSGEVKLSVTLGSGTDAIQGDGRAYVDGADNVRSVLMDNAQGNFTLDTNVKSGDGGRRLYVDFHAVSDNPPAPNGYTDGPVPVDVLINTVEETANGPKDLKAMKGGDIEQRKMAINWADTRTNLSYHLRHPGPDGRAARVQIECTLGGSTAGSCMEWTLTPLDSSALYTCPLKGCRTETFVNVYSMPFTFVLTKQ
jgi:hypothetical protein